MTAGHDWWQVHAEAGDLVVEYHNTGGNYQEKQDVQEVATIESKVYHANYKEAYIEAKRTVAIERAIAAQ